MSQLNCFNTYSATPSTECYRDECKLIKSELCRMRSELKGRIRSFKHLINVNPDLANVHTLIQNITDIIENVGWFVNNINNNRKSNKQTFSKSTNTSIVQLDSSKNAQQEQSDDCDEDNEDVNILDKSIIVIDVESEEDKEEENEQKDTSISVIPATQQTQQPCQQQQQLPPKPIIVLNRDKTKQISNKVNNKVKFTIETTSRNINKNNNNISNISSTTTTTTTTRKRKESDQNEEFFHNVFGTGDEIEHMEIENVQNMNIPIERQHSKNSNTTFKTITTRTKVTNNNNTNNNTNDDRTVVQLQQLHFCPAVNLFDISNEEEESSPNSILYSTQLYEDQQRLESFRHQVFNNHKALKTVFKHVTSFDLNSCSLVNKTWNSVSLIMNKDRYWIIRLTDMEKEYKSRHKRRASCIDKSDPIVQLKKQKEPQQQQQHKLLLQSLKNKVSQQSKKIEDCPSTKTFLIISQLPDLRRQQIQEIFNAVQNTVTHLYYGTLSFWGILNVEENSLFNILQSLPSCHTIKFFSSGLFWCDTTVRRHRESLCARLRPSTVKFPHIKRICFPDDTPDFPYVLLLHLLHACPNLENIYNFPLQETHALEMTGKGHLVCSIGHARPLISSENYFENFQKILNMVKNTGGLEKLTLSLLETVHDIYGEPWSWLLEQALDISKTRLKKLEIHPLEGVDFLIFHPLPNLTHLKFSSISTFFDKQSKYKKFFHPDMKLDEIFPNVTHISVALECEADCNSNIDEYFPLVQFQLAKCFQKVWHLTLSEKMGFEMVRRLNLIFPNITQLEIQTESHQLKKWMEIVLHIWNKLEKLIFVVNYFRQKTTDTIFGLPQQKPSEKCEDNKDFVLDSIITGINENKCRLLRKSLQFGKGIRVNDAEVSKYSIRNMTNLRLLKIIFNNMDHAENFPLFFSPLAFHHGFNLCANLLVFFGVAHDCPRRKAEIISSLKPLMSFVEFDSSYFDPYNIL